MAGTKPLPEPVFIQIYVAIWRHKATMSRHNSAPQWDNPIHDDVI